MKPVMPWVFTVDIAGSPTMSFEAKNLREANELARESWFLDDLRVLKSEGQSIWDGKALLRVRFATDPEMERYRGIAAEAEDTAGEILLAFLVTLDGMPVSSAGEPQ